jgi:hypothetical protein
MRKPALKDQLYGAVTEMMHNREYYYRSSVGTRHEYSHWTDQGREVLLEFIEAHSRRMLIADEADNDERAKNMVYNTLKQKE